MNNLNKIEYNEVFDFIMKNTNSLIRSVISYENKLLKSSFEVVADEISSTGLKYFGDFANDFDVQRAFLLNITKMMKVKNTNGVPYSVHPLRTALIGYYALRDKCNHDKLKDLLINALLHDYIEEGDGKSRASVSDLGDVFNIRIGKNSLLLTEPELDYCVLDKENKRKLEKCALLMQIDNENLEVLYNVLISDKIDNTFAIYYVYNKSVSIDEIRKLKISNKVASFYFIAEHNRNKASSILLKILVQALDEVCIAYELNQMDINKIYTEYENCYKEYYEKLDVMIKEWHKMIF